MARDGGRPAHADVEGVEALACDGPGIRCRGGGGYCRGGSNLTDRPEVLRDGNFRGYLRDGRELWGGGYCYLRDGCCPDCPLADDDFRGCYYDCCFRGDGLCRWRVLTDGCYLLRDGYCHRPTDGWMHSPNCRDAMLSPKWGVDWMCAPNPDARVFGHQPRERPPLQRPRETTERSVVFFSLCGSPCFKSKPWKCFS